MLETLKMGDALRRDCRVDGLDSRYSVLNRLVGKSVNVDELDYLSKRLDSFDASENAKFQAMAYKLGISNIRDFINLTFCCQQATVITSFSDLEKIGKDHMTTLNGGMMPVAEYQAVDGRKEALRLIQSGSGTVTPFGVVYDNGMVLEECYNGHQFPEFPCDSRLMVLKTAPKQGLAEGQNLGWRPWANDLLEIYLHGQKRACTTMLAKKYGVSPQVVRKYKRKFEEFIKNFWEVFRFDL